MGPVLEDDHRDITTALALAGATVLEVSAGTRLDVAEYRLRVVWPYSESFAEPGNDSSVVVSLEPSSQCGSCLKALFLGDLGEQPQRILMGRENFDELDVVKVSHHGSRDQYDGLYRAIQASVGLIGVGEENTYGHPTRGVMDILQASGTLPLRSDLEGIVTVSADAEGQLVVWSER